MRFGRLASTGFWGPCSSRMWYKVFSPGSMRQAGPFALQSASISQQRYRCTCGTVQWQTVRNKVRLAQFWVLVVKNFRTLGT